jgi:hypothetical protein
LVERGAYIDVVIWILPAATVVLVVVPVILAARGVAREAMTLRQSLASLTELRVPLLELRDEVTALKAGVPELRFRTRPALPPAP